MAAPRKKPVKSPLSPLDVLNVTGPKRAKTAAPAKTKAAAKPKAPSVLLDYPQSGERVLPGHYAVRVAAKPEVSVEVSVDGGPWQACREAVGYYWFDWSPAAPGAHTLVARAKNGGPRFSKSEERAVVVETPSAN